MALDTLLPLLLGLAWLLPLGSFVLILLIGPRLGRGGKHAGPVATGAIAGALVLSAGALAAWLLAHPPGAGGEHGSPTVPPVAGDWYTLAECGALRLTIGYYIDALSVLMCFMVTLVATCIHVYSLGYMHEELQEVTDHEVVLASGQALRRPGRFPRFFQYLSLFSFCMLGLVLAGNLAMVFVFWELVGICSYLLIGFYVERPSATQAANKAFIVNRVGDFGMLVGLMALWGSLGTLSFGDVRGPDGTLRPGLFGQVRPAATGHALVVPDGMVLLAARAHIEHIGREASDPGGAQHAVAQAMPRWREQGVGYWLLVVAGLGIFCGCVGKSAQVPLHVWLPDAMEGPTPVSALIHAATMVAAGVYLVGRCYALLTPEVLLVIAYVGGATLLIAATIALAMTDIKRVLAYSTVSQLGYMMLALGVGGWAAGLFHLLTHAFFKALLFLGAGSVIHACGTNEMTQMGGLRRKMPWTAWAMLVGCLAISGAGVPMLIGLSGYYSKDAILAQLFLFRQAVPAHGWLLGAAAVGAALTPAYMFRLWYLTFAGSPRDPKRFAHAHESPAAMVGPLVVLAGLAVVAGWRVPILGWSLTGILEQARPLGTAEGITGAAWLTGLAMPAEHLSHTEAIHAPATWTAFGMAVAGFLVATLFYGLRMLDPEAFRRRLALLYAVLRNKWWFDEVYHAVWVRPVLALSRATAAVDRQGIDWLADHLAQWTCALARLDDVLDRRYVDGALDWAAQRTYRFGLQLRAVQTGRLRHYMLWLAVGTVALFVLVSWYRVYLG